MRCNASPALTARCFDASVQRYAAREQIAVHELNRPRIDLAGAACIATLRRSGSTEGPLAAEARAQDSVFDASGHAAQEVNGGGERLREGGVRAQAPICNGGAYR